MARHDSAVAAGARTGDNADLVSDAATKIRAERGRTGDPVEESLGRNCGKSKCCRPGLTWRENLAAQFEVSLRAEVKLRKKALVFYRKLHRLQNT